MKTSRKSGEQSCRNPDAGNVKKTALHTGFSDSIKKPLVGLIDHTSLSDFPAISASPLKV